jgi:hypothetical protein
VRAQAEGHFFVATLYNNNIRLLSLLALTKYAMMMASTVMTTAAIMA